MWPTCSTGRLRLRHQPRRRSRPRSRSARGSATRAWARRTTAPSSRPTWWQPGDSIPAGASRTAGRHASSAATTATPSARLRPGGRATARGRWWHRAPRSEIRPGAGAGLNCHPRRDTRGMTQPASTPKTRRLDERTRATGRGLARARAAPPASRAASRCARPSPTRHPPPGPRRRPAADRRPRAPRTAAGRRMTGSSASGPNSHYRSADGHPRVGSRRPHSRRRDHGSAAARRIATMVSASWVRSSAARTGAGDGRRLVPERVRPGFDRHRDPRFGRAGARAGGPAPLAAG